jgi:hypothetical protein
MGAEVAILSCTALGIVALTSFELAAKRESSSRGNDGLSGPEK